MKTLSVVILAYKEKSTIPQIVFAVEAAPASGLRNEIVVLDDFSTDGIRDILEGRSKGTTESGSKRAGSGSSPR